MTVANTFDQAAAPLWPRWSQNALPGNDGYAFTAPVGSYAPNAFGLYDMLGGGLSRLPGLAGRVSAAWGAFVFTDEPVRTRLLLPRFGDDSGVRGAAWLALGQRV